MNLKSFPSKVCLCSLLRSPACLQLSFHSIARMRIMVVIQSGPCSDWDDSATELAHLGGAAPSAAKSGGNKLWEENWDDDDVEDNFSRNLR